MNRLGRSPRPLLLALPLLALLGACAKPICPDGMKLDPGKSQPGRVAFCRSRADAGRTLWIQLGEGGVRRQVCPFLAGRPGGLYQAWHKNGQRWLEGRYESGQKVGRWAQWDESGRPVADGEYRDGALVQGAPVGAPATCESVTW
ncbi:MAG TPA: hypothetical protein VMU50_05530 [Polyangia bacterium]|nr:hypothetical protein [Polyangia bacterium]